MLKDSESSYAILETFVEGGTREKAQKKMSLFMCSFCKASCKLNKAVIYNVSGFLIYFLPAGNTDESQLWEVHCSRLCILLINISLLGHVRSLAL